jgi:hypothetical protein
MKKVVASHYFIVPYSCSHVWFPTVHDVLHADWQEVWHSPQPPVAAVAF